jgi:D-alanyl-D-alanine dipeptidase
VIESGDQLMALQQEERIWIEPAYYAMGYRTATNVIILRQGTIAALRRASSLLPGDYSLVVWDGLRTLRTQREIAERFSSELSANFEDAHKNPEILEKYVAPVPTSEREFLAMPPPHTTGGAIDITLGDSVGRKLDLGAGFDEFGPNAATDYYERSSLKMCSDVTDTLRRDLRRLLYFAMTGAGFAPYPFEYWHFEYGTRRHAAFYRKSVAAYGPAVAFTLNGVL